MFTIKYDISQIDDVAKQIISHLQNNVVCFYGQMGAGKTTLIKALVKHLGSDDVVSSPTFSIVNEYEGKEKLIYHFDMYRIENETEALDFGMEEYFTSHNICFVEWPENILNLLPEYYDKISIEIIDDNTRTIIIA